MPGISITIVFRRVFDVQIESLIDKASGIFRAGQLLLKGVKTETVVDALI